MQLSLLLLDIQPEPGGSLHYRESTRLIIYPFRVESYVVFYLTWKSSSSHWNFMAASYALGPETAAPLTPKGRETLPMLRQRHRAFPGASLPRPRVISFRNYPGTSKSLSGLKMQLYRYSRRDKGSLKVPGYKSTSHTRAELGPTRVSRPEPPPRQAPPLPSYLSHHM